MPRNLSPSFFQAGPNASGTARRRTCPLNPDRTFYSVVCHLNGEAYARETDLVDMDFDQIVRDIADGQIEKILAVFAFNPAEGWANDVTEDVLAAAFPEDDDYSGSGGPSDGGSTPFGYAGECIGSFEAGCGRWAA
ncbi:hypothetical protein [uncultured Roseibium sp.]|uniref:hypothetical protein n=1 Tax=uncultured Roseibium sp. TaxID=1936171 RepID=UPI003217109E